jgi:hypothetical protein
VVFLFELLPAIRQPLPKAKKDLPLSGLEDILKKDVF